MQRILDWLFPTNFQIKLFLFVVLVGIVWETFFFINFTQSAWTEGLVFSWFMVKGLIPYKDFLMSYFPSAYMMMVPLHLFFGFNQNTTILLELASTILLFLFTTFFSFRWLSSWRRFMPPLYLSIWLPVLSENQFATNSYQNIMTFFIFILWWVWYQHHKIWLSILLGIFLGLSFTSMQVVMFFIAVVFASMGYQVVRNRRLLKSLLVTIGAFFIPVILILIYIVSNDALGVFVWWYSSYYLSAGGYPYSFWGKTLSDTIVFFAVLSPLLLVAEIIFFAICNPKNKKYNTSQYFFWLLMLIGFSVSFWFALWHTNRLVVAITVFAITLGLGMEKVINIGKKVSRLSLLLLTVIIVLNIVAVWLHAIPRIQRGFSHPREYQVLSKVYSSDPMYEVVKWIKENTAIDAKIFAITDPIIYIESDRLIGGRRTSNLPQAYRPLDKYATELQENPLDYWVVDERQWKRMVDFGYPDVSEFFQRVLDCEPVVARFEYFTIRSRASGKGFCI